MLEVDRYRGGRELAKTVPVRVRAARRVIGEWRWKQPHGAV
jgi:hypothetical protein